MDFQLAKAVIATFRDADADQHFNRLSEFRYRSWVRIYGWLDASGLALYFLVRIKKLEIEKAIPARVLMRLEENSLDNKEKTARMFDEFITLNRDLKNADVSYANLKGFTLAPDACTDIALRCQFDLDFLVDFNDINRFENILMRRGYSLAGTGVDVKEFKAGSERLPSVRDLYRAKIQRSVEVHFAYRDEADGTPRYDKFTRLQSKIWSDLELPVLSDLDRFLAHAQHLFKHLKSEWTRASWILEYANFVTFYEENKALWIEVHKNLALDPNAKVAVGVATLIAEQSFGIAFVPEILKWSVRDLPVPVRLWAERYGNRVLLAEFPGTKLYRLLLKALSNDAARPIRKKSFPFNWPAKISVEHGDRSLTLRLEQLRNQTNYFCFRLKFHLKQSFIYKIEEARWKRSIASLHI
jgi:hypothetical protein